MAKGLERTLLPEHGKGVGTCEEQFDRYLWPISRSRPQPLTAGVRIRDGDERLSARRRKTGHQRRVGGQLLSTHYPPRLLSSTVPLAVTSRRANCRRRGFEGAALRLSPQVIVTQTTSCDAAKPPQLCRARRSAQKPPSLVSANLYTPADEALVASSLSIATADARCLRPNFNSLKLLAPHGKLRCDSCSEATSKREYM